MLFTYSKYYNDTRKVNESIKKKLTKYRKKILISVIDTKKVSEIGMTWNYSEEQNC